MRARLEAGKFCSESESSEMISVYQESVSGATVWLASGRIWKWIFIISTWTLNDINAPSYCNIPKKPLIEKRNPNCDTSLLLRRLFPAKEVADRGTRRPTGEWKIETWRPNCGRRNWGGLQGWGSFVEEIWVLGWNSRNSKGEIFIQIFSDCSCPNNFLAMAVVICSCWM